jgi:hypothetical protein
VSVTFSTSPQSKIIGAKIKCWEFVDLQISTVPETVEEDAKIHNLECSECRTYGGALIEYDHEVNDLNISNGNAHYLLENLGLAESLYGNLKAEDFLARALIADALLPLDPGTPTIQEGNIVYGGREPMYLQNKIARLIELCNWASAHKAEITWG